MEPDPEQIPPGSPSVLSHLCNTTKPQICSGFLMQVLLLVASNVAGVAGVLRAAMLNAAAAGDDGAALGVCGG